MNLVLRITTLALFVAVPFYALGIASTPRGQVVLGVGLAVWLFIWLVWRSYRRQLGPLEGLDDTSSPPHPLATIVMSAAHSIFIHCCLLVVYCLVWGLGHWTASASVVRPDGGETEMAAAVSHRVHIGPSQLKPEVRGDVCVSVVDDKFDNGIQFLTVLVTNPADGTALSDLALGDFVVTASGKPQPILTARQAYYERPVAAGIVRDVSKSVLSSSPFADIVLEWTSAIIVTAREKLRAPVVGVVDFAGDCVVTLPWTTDLSKLETVPLRIPASPDKTAGTNAIILSCRSLARRSEHRRLCLITDGGDNVESSFDRSGVVAEAQRCGVTIDVIALPTSDLTAERKATLKFIADETKGRYLDGATANLKGAVAQLVEGWRMPLPDYRFSFQANQAASKDSLTVHVVQRSATPLRPPVIASENVAIEKHAIGSAKD